jgi:pimeloyl-ACP methyl ester carboxylesterase
MSQTLLISGLLCDATVWRPLLECIDGKVADFSTQDNLTTMARDCLRKHSGHLKIAGHSMGARVAMEMARLAPERVEKLALLDTGIHPLRDGEPAKRAEIVHFAHENGMAALANRWLPGMVYAPNQSNKALMTKLKNMVLRATPDLHARQIKALVDRPDASAYLAQIECPVLLIVGQEDQWSPVSQHEDMLKLLPNARLEIIADAGHFAPIEQPESVARLLADFLS